MHFGFTNMGSKMCNFRVIANTHFKFWFGSPCNLEFDFTCICSLWSQKEFSVSSKEFISSMILLIRKNKLRLPLKWVSTLRQHGPKLWNCQNERSSKVRFSHFSTNPNACSHNWMLSLVEILKNQNKWWIVFSYDNFKDSFVITLFKDNFQCYSCCQKKKVFQKCNDKQSCNSWNDGNNPIVWKC